MSEEKGICHRTDTEIATIIRNAKNTFNLRHNGPQVHEDIQGIEAAFNIVFPDDYRHFLGNYGALLCQEVSIFGLGNKIKDLITLSNVFLHFRIGFPDIPANIVPIEDLGDGNFACLETLPDKTSYCPVVRVNLSDGPNSQKQFDQLAGCFRDYLFNRLSELKSNSFDDLGFAWENFERHVLNYQAKYGYDHAKGGKLPRNHEWRPYRYCIQDVVFGVTVVRHSREFNNLSVDVFLTADVPEYGPLAGARALTVFLLSEAYKCGGTMAIHFTNNVENGCIPAEIHKLGHYYGIVFREKNKIMPDEAKTLYAAITEFSPSMQNLLKSLESRGRLKVAQACYAVNHGVWTREQVEMIVLGSDFPESVLTGGATPEQWQLFYNDLLHARAALLGGMLDRVLSQRFRVQDGIEYDMENDTLLLEILFDSDSYTKEYRCKEPVKVPWLYPDQQNREVVAGTPFFIMVRARDGADLMLNFQEDIKSAISLKKGKKAVVFLLVPNDFYDLTKQKRGEFFEYTQDETIGLMVCPEHTRVFDKEAASKLANSRILRR